MEEGNKAIEINTGDILDLAKAEQKQFENLGIKEVTRKSNGKFDLKKTKLLLTYRTWIPKKEYKEWLTACVSVQCPDIRFLEIAHEIGDKTLNYEHSHVLVDFRDQFSTSNERYFDYNGIHPHIKHVPRGKAAWNTMVNYIAKYDKENEHLKINSLVQRVHDKKNIQEVLKMVEKPSDVNGIITLYEYKKNDSAYIGRQPTWPWQVELMEELKKDADDRTIIWYWDDKGSSGKSTVGDYMSCKDPDNYYYLSNMSGGPRDINTNIAGAIDRGWTGHCILIDLPRDWKDRDIYKSLEEIKNRKITTTKWKGRLVIFPKFPHVVVMCNFLPDTDKMTFDRWNIREIKGRETRARKMDITEVKASRHQTEGVSTTKSNNIHDSYHKPPSPIPPALLPPLAPVEMIRAAGITAGKPITMEHSF